MPRRRVLVTVSAVSACSGLALVALALPREIEDWPGAVAGALGQPALGVPASVAVAVAVLFCLRMWRYRKLLRLPGPIQVLPTQVDEGRAPETGNGEGPPTPDARRSRLRLDIHFRQRLSELRLLSAPTLAPGKRASTDFVELLETSSIEAKRPFAAFGTLMRIIRPTHAYEVTATLLMRHKQPSRGVAIETVILPGRRATLRTYWADRWEDALDRGANGVAAEVVPRSQHSDTGPWCLWKGLQLDPDLFTLYQRGQQRRRERRFEEALEAFYETVRRDPGNGYFRIALGATQEDLALYLDALLTYQGVPGLVSHRLGLSQRRAVKRAEMFARHRYAILLGFGDNLAEQWLPAPVEGRASRRSEELRELRERLRPILIEQFQAMTVASADVERLGLRSTSTAELVRLLDERPHLDRSPHHPESAKDRQLSRREKDDNRRLRERRLHLFFHLLAEAEVRALFRRYSDRDRAKFGSSLTATSEEVLSSWTKLRADRARYLLSAELHRQSLSAVRRGRRSGTANKLHLEWNPGDWPPSPDEIRALWKRDGLPRRPRRSVRRRLDASYRFNEHYDAACIFAVPLLPGPGLADHVDRARREEIAARTDELAAASVGELHRAACRGGSTALAARWLWVATDDPDLAGLRAHPAFRQFESQWLPSLRPTPIRPTRIVRLNASRHSTQLLRMCADQTDRLWRSRIDLDGDVQIHTVLAWWEEETATWDLLRELAYHHRHWQTRLRVMKQLTEVAQRSGLAPTPVAHPIYGENPIEGDPESVDLAARREIYCSDLRIHHLAMTIGPRGGGPPEAFEEWRACLHHLAESARALSEDVRRPLAENRSVAWRRLAMVFGDAPSDEGDVYSRHGQEFARAAAALSELPPPRR